MRANGADALAISALDEVAWLFNIRGGDVPYNPVCIAYAFVTQEEAVLFLPKHGQALTHEAQLHLAAAGVVIRDYDQMFPHMAEIAQSGLRFWIDPSKVGRNIPKAK